MESIGFKNSPVMQIISCGMGKIRVIMNRGEIEFIESYIINDKAVVIFWKDGSKTVATLNEDDKFDKTIGFGIAMFKHEYIESKNMCKKMLNSIKNTGYMYVTNKGNEHFVERLEINPFKTFMEGYINHNTFRNMEKTRKFIKSLKATGKREKING